MATLHGDLLAGRWRLGDRLGRGAVADVYEAFDDSTGERVAVKFVRNGEVEQRARLEREIEALSSFEHPGLVRVLGHGDLDGRPYVVLECVAGGSLAEELERSGPLEPERVASIGAALADALAHAHARGVVHRDVKPSNVLLAEDGPRLADFGVAWLEGSAALTRSGFTVGTAGYLAPEQVRGEPVGPAADVYSLGLLLLEAATGERAYPGNGVPAAMARLDHPPAIPATVPPALAALLRSMTAMDPSDRPSASTAAADLSVLADGGLEDGTTLLPVADAPTELVAVAGPPPILPDPAPAPAAALAPDPGPDPVRAAVPVPSAVPADAGPRMLVALVCFAIGFLLVLAIRAESSGIDLEDLPVPTTATTVATTAPPATTVPLPPPHEDDEEDEDERRGNGNGRGRRGGDD